MGIAMSGFGIGGLLVPAVAWSLTTLGWRPTAFISGVFIIMIGFPIAQLFRQRPEQYGYLPDGDTIPGSRLRWRLFAGVPGTQRNVRRRRSRRLHSQGSNADTRVLAAQYGARHGAAHGWRSLPAPGPTHNGERRSHHNGGGRRGVGDDRIQHSGTGGRWIPGGPVQQADVVHHSNADARRCSVDPCLRHHHSASISLRGSARYGLGIARANDDHHTRGLLRTRLLCDHHGVLITGSYGGNDGRTTLRGLHGRHIRRISHPLCNHRRAHGHQGRSSLPWPAHPGFRNAFAV